MKVAVVLEEHLHADVSRHKGRRQRADF